MGRNKKAAAEPDTPEKEKQARTLQLDAIMRDAAAVVLAEIRKMKDAQTMDGHGSKVAATDLPNLVNLQDVARQFRARLAAVGSNEDALGQRLQKWRLRGVHDDPVVPRGRCVTAHPRGAQSRIAFSSQH